MNTPAHIPPNAPGNSSKVPGITIIYEDRAAGLRAKDFSDQLAVSLGLPSIVAPSCWRVEMIDLPPLAAEAACDAAASEFLILSLCGNAGLSLAMKEWIETWLAAAGDRPACLIALFDLVRSRANQANSVRYYLRAATSEMGIAFFAHSIDAADTPASPETTHRPATGGSFGVCRDFAHPALYAAA